MAEEERTEAGFCVEGVITAVKGNCSWGHKVGDKFDLSWHNTAGLCGSFYHNIFPYIVMLQFGGGFPREWGGPEVVELECLDWLNAVRIKLRRIRE